MADHARPDARDRPAAAAPQRGRAPAGAGTPAQAQVLTLQRAAGNRATARFLSRWAAHPDKEKKGMLMSDGAVGEYNRFNLPLGK